MTTPPRHPSTHRPLHAGSRRAPRAMAAVLAGALLLTGCGSDEEPVAEPTPSATPTPTPTPSPTPTPDPTGPIAPLTGQVVDQDVDLGRPVLAVKVENSSASRPQAGLEVADVVYEELVEGGVTRFIAIFHSRVPETVGPIRSGRLVDARVLPAYKGLMALSGARDQVIAALRNAGITTLYDGDGFYRESSRKAPHNLYAKGQALYERGAKRSGTDAAPQWWEFDAERPDGFIDCQGNLTCEDAGTSFAVSMSRVYTTGWEYDADAGVYHRSQNGKPFTTPDGDPISAANVVVLGMSVGAGECCDTSGSPLVETDVIGDGRAIILRDGFWYEATWEKASSDEPLVLLDEAGEPFRFKPGSTWIHLAPKQNLPLPPT